MSQLTRIVCLALLALGLTNGLFAQKTGSSTEREFISEINLPPALHSPGGNHLGRLINIAGNAFINGGIARSRGIPFWPALAKSAAVSVGLEAVYAADSYLDWNGLPPTPMRFIAGQIGNSMLANISSGDRLCADIETVYLLLQVEYNCGLVRLTAKLKPLLPTVYLFAAGASLDLPQTIGNGLPVLTSRLEGVAGFELWGAVVYHRSDQDLKYWRQEEAKLREYHPSSTYQAWLTERAIRFIGQNQTAIKKDLSFTINHETRHALQEHYQNQLADEVAKPAWYVQSRVRFFGLDLDLSPAIEAVPMVLSLVSYQAWPHDLRPAEIFANAENGYYRGQPSGRRLLVQYTDSTRSSVRQLKYIRR